MDKTPAQNLCDILYALGIQVKFMEDLMNGLSSGMRTQQDFNIRFKGQTDLFLKNLKNVKPAVEALITEGYSKIDESSVSSDSTEQVQLRESDSVGEGTQIQS